MVSDCTRERLGAKTVSLATVQPEPNGFPFDPTFESWKPLNTTDRGDNNTFRFVLGNDIAMKAAQSGTSRLGRMERASQRLPGSRSSAPMA
jgi:hypothetical protein